MEKFDFKQGDIIEFCEQEFKVMSNTGLCGTVQENCEDGKIIKGFYWSYGGENSILKNRG